MTFKVPEKFRVTKGPFASDPTFGCNGAFVVHAYEFPLNLNVIASDGGGWEHVSVSTSVRCPTWEEMCFIKSLFWDDEDTVMQLHPPKSQWVNNHSYCLHLWRTQDPASPIPLPPSMMVGYQSLNLPI